MKCNNCAGGMGLPAMGNCSGCGAMIGQMSDKYCAQCSKTKNACQTCGTPLTPTNSQADSDNVDSTSDDGSERS
ncbi:MAG: hypothetical protein WC028_24080 [Candidatus Obscuribacterales bacterium]